MQRAASSDTLSTMAFSKGEAQFHNSGPQHDIKQQLSHSQSMLLPENGKVFTPRARTHEVVNRVHGSHTQAERRGNADKIKQFSNEALHMCTYTHRGNERSLWCPLPVFQLVQQCRDFSCNVTNIVVEPPSPQSSPDSDGCTPVRKKTLYTVETLHEFVVCYSLVCPGGCSGLRASKRMIIEDHCCERISLGTKVGQLRKLSTAMSLD